MKWKALAAGYKGADPWEDEGQSMRMFVHETLKLSKLDQIERTGDIRRNILKKCILLISKGVSTYSEVIYIIAEGLMMN